MATEIKIVAKGPIKFAKISDSAKRPPKPKFGRPKNPMPGEILFFGTDKFCLYSAGACLPPLAPFGCFGQKLCVKDAILVRFIPQYLQIYSVFSLPLYKLCLPSPKPSGCLLQKPFVKDDILKRLVPQYSQ